LLDTQMPGMSGFQVCEALKADPELADVPVMVVTASAEISKGNSTCGRIQQEQHEMTASPRKIEPSRALAQP
jgi:CheY-like chemotaxis protein